MMQSLNNKDFLKGFLLQGCVVCITGASSGIGAYLSRLFYAAGAHLIISSRELSRAQTTRELIRQEITPMTCDQQIFPVALDQGDSESIHRALADILARYERVDVLINNAGMASPEDSALVEQNVWSKIIDVNLNAPRLISQQLAQQAIKYQYPMSIVHMASVTGLSPMAKASAYSVSKAALIHLCHSQALEWARYQIRVNCLAPGYLRTDMNRTFIDSEAGERLVRRIPQRRLGQFEDLALPTLLLASGFSNYMTGSVMTIDGGHVCHRL